MRVLFGVVRAIVACCVLLSVAIWLPGISHHSRDVTALLFVGTLPFLLALALAHRGRPVAAGRITIAALTLGAMTLMACFGGIDGPVGYTLPLSIAVSGLLAGRRAAAVVAAANLAYLLLLARLETLGIAPFIAGVLSTKAVVISIAAGIGLVFLVISIYTREVELARAEAAESTRRAIASWPTSSASPRTAWRCSTRTVGSSW
jgi:hypothetical protein